MVQCCVKGCTTRVDKKTRPSGFSFFTFPSRPALKASWLRAIGRPGWDPQNRRICSIHFKPELITTTGPKIMLNRRAIPELALPGGTVLEASALKVCRICLVSDVKMHSFENGLLKSCMESILKLTKNVEITGLPTLICYECAPLLLKCHNLMQKCTLAQTALSNIYKEHGEVTKEMVRKLNRDKINLASTLTHYYSTPTKTFHFVYNEETNSSQLLKTKFNGCSKKEENIKTDIDITSRVDLKVYPEITIKKYDPNITKMEIELDSMKMEEEQMVDVEIEEIDYVNDFDDNIDDVLVESDGNDDDDKQKQDDTVEIEIPHEDNIVVDKSAADSSEKQTSSEGGNTKEYKGMLRKMQQYFDIEDLETKEQQLAVWQEYKGINPEDPKHDFECGNCSKTFAYEKAYKKHIVKHTGPPNILCPLCKKGRFKNEESMREHYTANHSRKFTCKICYKMFPNFAFAERHYMSTHKLYTHRCAECAFTTPQLSQLHAHMRDQHNARHLCTKCARAFTGERAMKLHMAVAHGICQTVTHFSQKCSLAFLRMTAYLSGNKLYICQECKLYIDQKKLEFKCEECNLSFVTEEAKKTHLLISERHKEGFKPTQHVLVATCLKCGREFASDLALRVHSNTEHARAADDGPQKFKYPKKCDFCDTILTGRADHWNHIQRRHPDKKNTYKPIVNYICQICGKGVGSTTKLDEHMTRHAGTPKYKCDVCEKPFYEKGRLKIHKLIHSDEPQYHCDVCGRRFKTRDSMRKHQKVVHTNDLNYACTYCGHRFKSADSLRIHKKSHMKDLATTSSWDETFSSF